MNDILESLYNRKSTRVFTGEHIPERDVEAILNASFQAPTAGNQQLYTILRITDPSLRHTVAELCDHQPFIERDMGWTNRHAYLNEYTAISTVVKSAFTGAGHAYE